MEKQINLMDLMRLYLHRWWALVIGFVVGAMLAGTFTIFFITPKYTATGTLYAENSSDAIEQGVQNVDLNAIVVRKELVSTYAEVLSSNVFLKTVAEESGLDYTYGELLRMISIESKNGTEIMEISVENEDPQHAYIIAQKIMNMADEQISYVVNGGSVKILDEPELPTVASSPNVIGNIKVGALIGLALSLLIVFLIDKLDTKVEDAEQLAEYFKYPVLGEIPFLSPNKELIIKGNSKISEKVVRNA